VLRRWVGSAPLEVRGGVEAEVHVLTSAHWPQYPTCDLVLPAPLRACTDAFQQWYVAAHSAARSLVWQPALARVVLRARFPSGRKELSVSCFQAVVLMHFNDRDEASMADLLAATHMDETDMRLTLVSLSANKEVRLLVRTGRGKDVKPDDVFAFNRDFRHKLLRLKINQVQLRESKKEQEDTQGRVLAERQFQIDAAVVRIMKTRQTLTHQDLLAETFTALRFPAMAADVKKRIESLLEREFLERDEADPNQYRYLA
jgi:cullin-4